jgi:hypothetical protein
VLLAAVPTVPEVLPPLEEVLFDAELPVVPAFPPESAAAVFAVEPKLAVLLPVFALFAAAANDALAALLLAVVNAAFEEKEFVVELELLLLLASDADAVSDALLPEATCCALFLLVAKLSAEPLVLELSSVNDLLSVVLWFREASRVDEEVFDLVTFELLLTVSSLF